MFKYNNLFKLLLCEFFFFIIPFLLIIEKTDSAANVELFLPSCADWGPYMRQDLATAKCANPRKISDQQSQNGENAV